MDATQFEIFLTLLVFVYFYSVGQCSTEKSGGVLMMFSGFTFLYFEWLMHSNNIMNAYYLFPLMTPIAIYIILMGVYKWLFDNELSEEG